MMIEDLTPFFSVTEFADLARLGGVSVAGIFDNGYDEVALGMGLAGSTPAFTMDSAQVPATVVGAAFSIRGVRYTVTESLPDGTGITRLRLRK